ncbi:MAG: response regulator transcription factor, partial [Promicromonosporaceae bacterium]|nr:response regulator transcription factor [Promicromonosporaceae bacterium]
MINVLVVDDQPLIRSAVVDLMANEPGLAVVGEADNGRTAVAAAKRLKPDVVLMDIRMPQMDGIAATTAICADPNLSGTKVLILTTFEEDPYVVGAMRAGASGFLGKGAAPREITAAIR